MALIIKVKMPTTKTTPHRNTAARRRFQFLPNQLLCWFGINAGAGLACGMRLGCVDMSSFSGNAIGRFASFPGILHYNFAALFSGCTFYNAQKQKEMAHADASIL
jgi:hypothetical protein